MSQGNTITFAGEGIVRVEFPTLVDQVVIVSSIVANKVAILIGWVIDAGCAIPILIVDFIQ